MQLQREAGDQLARILAGALGALGEPGASSESRRLRGSLHAVHERQTRESRRSASGCAQKSAARICVRAGRPSGPPSATTRASGDTAPCSACERVELGLATARCQGSSPASDRRIARRVALGAPATDCRPSPPSGSTNSAWMARPSLRTNTNWSPSGKAPLDDGRGERRDQVLVDRALQRPRAHLRREALLEQELQRGGLPLHRPVAVLEAAPLQHAVELLLRISRISVARQRPEHDHLVEPVLELGPEGLADRAQ